MPTECGECKRLRNNRIADPHWTEAYLKLLHHVELRLAVEMAVPLLKQGHIAVAVAILENVPARGREIDLTSEDRNSRNSRSAFAS